MSDGKREIQSNLERAASPPLTVENNYATKSRLVTIGCPIYTPFPKITAASPSTISTPSNTPILDNPTHHAKRHPDPISRFATVHPPDRQTDGPTHWIGDRPLPRAAYAYCIAIIILISEHLLKLRAWVWLAPFLQARRYAKCRYSHGNSVCLCVWVPDRPDVKINKKPSCC